MNGKEIKRKTNKKNTETAAKEKASKEKEAEAKTKTKREKNKPENFGENEQQKNRPTKNHVWWGATTRPVLGQGGTNPCYHHGIFYI